MPTLEENRNRWTTYDWFQQGDEWSSVWGGTDNLWGSTIYPRIRPHLGRGTILEIACGGGRISSYLRPFCDRLLLVDMAENCVEHCRRLFADDDRIECFLNDGRSLAFAKDRSVDFVFSWDSLVHCELDVVSGYLEEIARVLCRDGRAFLHHSNVGSFRDEEGNLNLPPPTWGGEANLHWRGVSVSATEIARLAGGAHGFELIVQELVPWGHTELTDCFTLLGFEPAHQAILKTTSFMDSAEALRRSSELFAR